MGNVEGIFWRIAWDILGGSIEYSGSCADWYSKRATSDLVGQGKVQLHIAACQIDSNLM